MNVCSNVRAVGAAVAAGSRVRVCPCSAVLRVNSGFGRSCIGVAALKIQRRRCERYVVVRADRDDENGNENGVENGEEYDSEEAGEPGGAEETEEDRGLGFFARIWKRGEKSNEDEEIQQEDETPDEEKEEVQSNGLLRSLWNLIRGKNGDFDRDSEVPGLEDLDIRWEDLLEPSIDNLLALILTSLLGLALLQISWQLLLVTLAIIVSALKYAVLAAFLVAFIIFFL